jgi:23S rRNA (uridine2552-2'-O)-methyltransferase
MPRSRSSPYKLPDHFTREAKKAGYPARSVFKLEEIDRRVHLIRPGMRVLDLGAAPGSWSLYASQKIGATGKLLAVDLSPLGTVLPANATFFQGDALTLEDGEGARLAELAPYDIVLSDMAPRTTGSKTVDQARSFELFMRALAVAGSLCRPGGAFVGKLFMSEELRIARSTLKGLFAEERLIRPEGTRSVSTELFLVGLGRKKAA